MDRYLSEFVRRDLGDKMVFLSGPRQVGKTTLSLRFLQDIENYDAPELHPAYFNWDYDLHRQQILTNKIPKDQKILVFDEIHKYKTWRRFLKGFYDVHKSKTRILVTGSARLDYYRRGGDSLMGRYYFYRLHPLSPKEVEGEEASLAIGKLLRWGGFPEPFFRADSTFHARWQNLRRSRLVQEDLIHLEQVRELSQLELMMSILPERVGSILSVNSLREALGVSFVTADKWLEILSNLYYCYRVSPYTPSRVKAMKKERKLYLWDWSLIHDEGARLENFLASMLLKYCHFREDAYGESLQISFLRDKEKREIDFVILKNRKPLFAIECKSRKENLSPNIRYFADKLPQIPRFYQLYNGSESFEIAPYRTIIMPLHRFISEVLDL